MFSAQLFFGWFVNQISFYSCCWMPGAPAAPGAAPGLWLYSCDTMLAAFSASSPLLPQLFLLLSPFILQLLGVNQGLRGGAGACSPGRRLGQGSPGMLSWSLGSLCAEEGSDQHPEGTKRLSWASAGCWNEQNEAR